jgi:cellulose synthase (UDP-forming)
MHPDRSTKYDAREPPVGLPRWRLNVARCAGVLALIGGAGYLAWRAPQLGSVGVMGTLLYAAEIVNYLAFAFVAVLLWAPRWRREPPEPLDASLDILIPVCGEETALVAETVRAALAITYPHRTVVCNDGRRAGVPAWAEIDDLCDELGVTCLTRMTGRPGKAGNLNFALEHTRGEMVGVVDADHNARANLGELTMGYFADPRIAFVASKQSFFVETGDTLGHQELFFYNSIQPAKDAHNAAFSCGNGVVYRRAALTAIGGFSEWNIVEDLTTSYELHANGWRSAYVPTPLTVGLAPPTAAEYSRQRLRWATDGLRLFFWDNPLLKRGLSVRQRMHYLITTGWYLVAALYLVFIAAPIAWVLFDITPMRVSSTAEYLLWLLVYLLPVGGFLVAHAGWRGALRPAQMQLYLAPVYALAIVRAIIARPVSGVTSKTRPPRFSLLTGVQHGVLATLLVAIGFGVATHSGSEWGAIVWACLLAAALANPASMVTLRADSAQALRVTVTAPVIVAAAMMFLIAWAPAPRAFDSHTGIGAAPPAAAKAAKRAPARPAPLPELSLRPSKHGVYIGAHSRALSRPTLSLDAWQHAHGARPRIVHTFQQWWGPIRTAPIVWMREVAAQGAVPMITWEPWNKPFGSVHDPNQRPEVLRDIAAGRYDGYVRRFARKVAAFRNPVMIRFAHEMNGNWYPWSVGIGSNTPRRFVRAWRHVHNVFEREGALNVSWVWSIEAFAGGTPTPRSTLWHYYPGKRYVDWVGLSGFNWGPAHHNGGWLSFRDVFKRVYPVVAGFNKPVMIAETGTDTSRDANLWMRHALKTVETDYARVKALVFYDARNPVQDFRFNDRASSGLRAAARGPFWHPLLHVVPVSR